MKDNNNKTPFFISFALIMFLSLIVLVDYKSDKSTYQQFAIEIFDNTLYVGTDNGLYYLQNDKLKPYSDELNKQDLKIHRFYNDNNEKLWLALFYNSNKENEKP